MKWQPSPAQHRALQWLMLEGSTVKIADSGRVIANKEQVYPASNCKAWVALAARQCVRIGSGELRITEKGCRLARQIRVTKQHGRVA